MHSCPRREEGSEAVAAGGRSALTLRRKTQKLGARTRKELCFALLLAGDASRRSERVLAETVLGTARHVLEVGHAARALRAAALRLLAPVVCKFNSMSA